MIRSAAAQPPEIEMEIVTDPEYLARAKKQDDRAQRNWDWFQSRARDIYQNNRGKFLCISGQQVFVADTAEQVLKLAKETFPEDDGRFTWFVPSQRTQRLYANQWPVVSVC